MEGTATTDEGLGWPVDRSRTLSSEGSSGAVTPPPDAPAGLDVVRQASGPSRVAADEGAVWWEALHADDGDPMARGSSPAPTAVPAVEQSMAPSMEPSLVAELVGDAGAPRGGR